jgi:uncharacterized protein
MSDKMGPGTNALNWFEIPMTDVDRAKKFYETIFDHKMELMEFGPSMTLLMFPSDMQKVGGALVKSEQHKPSMEGAIIYLNGNPDLQHVVDRIEGAGGKVLMPKTEIGSDFGFMAFFQDSEGNAVGLHSNA